MTPTPLLVSAGQTLSGFGNPRPPAQPPGQQAYQRAAAQAVR